MFVSLTSGLFLFISGFLPRGACAAANGTLLDDSEDIVINITLETLILEDYVGPCIRNDNCAIEQTDDRLTSSCLCGAKCIEYKDCCSDSAYYDEQKMVNPTTYKCTRFNFMPDVFVKGYCADTWKDAEISEKCLFYKEHNLNTFTPEFSVPVTSFTTNITYKNVFCAICNFEENLHVWTIRIQDMCYPESDDEISATNAQDSVVLKLKGRPIGSSTMKFNGERWYFVYEGTPYYCHLYLEPPKNFTFDICDNKKSGLSGTCAQNWSNADVDYKCKSTFSLVTDSFDNYYRNKYCAYCNFLNESSIHPYKHCKTNEQKASKSFKDLVNLKPDRELPLCVQKHTAVFEKVRKYFCANRKPPQLNETDLLFDWYTSVALSVSLVFLSLHLAVFLVVKELQTIGGKNLAAFCVTLVLAYSAFLLGNVLQGASCFIDAALTYYFFVTSFSWMFTISFDLWKTFSSITRKCRAPSGDPRWKFRVYCFCNWILCLVPVTFAVYLDLYEEGSIISPQFGTEVGSCWFQNQYALLLFFVFPLFCIIVLNFTLFLRTAYSISANRCKSANKKDNLNFMLYMRLVLLTGFTWITCFVAGYFHSTVIWAVFVILNTSQGVFIFWAFTCKKVLMRKFFNRLGVCESLQTGVLSSNTRETAISM